MSSVHLLTASVFAEWTESGPKVGQKVCSHPCVASVPALDLCRLPPLLFLCADAFLHQVRRFFVQQQRVDGVVTVKFPHPYPFHTQTQPSRVLCVRRDTRRPGPKVMTENYGVSSTLTEIKRTWTHGNSKWCA